MLLILATKIFRLAESYLIRMVFWAVFDDLQVQSFENAARRHLMGISQILMYFEESS